MDFLSLKGSALLKNSKSLKSNFFTIHNNFNTYKIVCKIVFNFTLLFSIPGEEKPYSSL